MTHKSRLQSIILVKLDTQAACPVTPEVTSREKRHSVSIFLCIYLSCLLAFSLLHSSGPRLGNGATHSGLDPPTSMNNLDSYPQDMPTDQPELESSSLTLSSQVILLAGTPP